MVAAGYHSGPSDHQCLLNIWLNVFAFQQPGTRSCPLKSPYGSYHDAESPDSMDWLPLCRPRDPQTSDLWRLIDEHLNERCDFSG
jgi:hypothetical protein